MNVALTAVGGLVVLAVLQDVFTTVLYPGSGRGLIRKPLVRASWAAFRAAGRTTHGVRRRSLLSYAGPAQIVLTMGAWLLLLLVGWALIYRPALGRAIVSASGPTDASWATALYYSGFSLTTLGTGDVVATTSAYRLLTITEAGVGFLTISMVITYFLSVYSQLPSRNAFAQALHQRTRGTGDAAVIVASVAERGDAAAEAFFSSMADALRALDQSHRSYPVLRHFNHRDPQYALPRILLTVLDTATLVAVVLDPVAHGRTVRSPGLAEVHDAARALLDELAPRPPRGGPPDRPTARRWAAHAVCTAQRVAAVGGRPRDDLDTAAQDYVAARSRWEPQLRALAEGMAQEPELHGPGPSEPPPTCALPQ